MLNLFLAVVRRDLMLALRQKSDIIQTLFFFAVVITLVPLGVGAEQNLLRTMAPGVVWVAALLAALQSLPSHSRSSSWQRFLRIGSPPAFRLRSLRRSSA